jgi:multidrug efflux pump subunit AcrA (membrane-fusion protein)
MSIGQPATITLETWPNVAIAGEVVAIAPSAQTNPGSALVSYEVYLSLGDTALPVRVGMTANANLITAERSGVLLVPNQAINANRENGTYTVTLVTGETTQEVAVTIGLRDGQHTQITDGLNEGDELLIGNSLPTTSFTPGPGGDGGPFGGNGN